MSIDARQSGRHARRSVAEAGCVEPLRSAGERRRRLSTWWWAAAQMAAAAALTRSVVLVGGLLLGTAISAVVLNGIPASGGWVPTRRLDGTLGVLAALVVTYGVAPSRPLGIEIQEEVRGLLADLITIADELTPSGSLVLAESVSAHEAADNGTRFGSSARRCPDRVRHPPGARLR